MELCRQSYRNASFVQIFDIQGWPCSADESSRPHSVTFTFRLLTIFQWRLEFFDSNSATSFVISLFRLSHHLSAASHLVVHAGFRLAPCRPLLGFQVNQRNFYVRTPVLFTDIDCCANFGSSNTTVKLRQDYITTANWSS